ncbi:acyl-CoA synthetase [Listeria rocourtiae]|uniref:AMP-binding protein n=1 Tax=Listeria rocourtiae TaxID=647910 RepID=UPI001627E7EB|nr:acyl-CoA synthetase [Listeria rocourtiae]MBC1434888.1 acyl-CoA synthetase [Listeria rocourtiae]
MFNKYKPLNLYTNFAEAAERFPRQAIYFDEPLTAFPEFQLQTTYAESKEALIKKATQLHKIGVKKGEKIIIYKSAKFDTYLLAVAASYLGAVPIMISEHLPAETMDILVARLDDPWMVFDGDTAAKAQTLKNLPASKLIAVEDILATTFDQLCEQECLTPDTISYMTHTSGTTGVPKLIAHSANSMGWRTKWQKNILSLIRKRGLVAFHISPVHSRFNIGISSLMAKGFPLLPIANPSRSNISRVLKDYAPMVLETHPNHFVQWASLAREVPSVFESVKYYHSTFDAINKETMATFLRCSKYRLPVFLQVYGQSECGPMIMRFHTKSTLKTTNARAMGIGMPGLTKARIVNKDGKPVRAGVSGNIQMFSKGRALTYYKETPRFEENVYGAWWDSGDYGVKSRLGGLSLLDRQVDLVDKIDSTLAIEDALLDELTFLDEVVIIRGKNGSPQPIIAVSEHAEMNWDLWWKKVSDLPHLNEPILMNYEEMPRTATMKIQRLELERSLQSSEN